MVLLVIFLLLAASFFLMRGGEQTTQGGYAVAAADGKEIMRIPLDKDGNYELSDLKYPVVITIKDGKAAVTESGCPEQVCVSRGYISREGEIIICLPNKLTVTIEGKEGAYDVII